jgi:hypothetical protein
MKFFIPGLIKQSLQLQAQVTLASLRWCHTRESALSLMRENKCASAVGALGVPSVRLKNLYCIYHLEMVIFFSGSLQNCAPDPLRRNHWFTSWQHNYHSDFCHGDATFHNCGVSATNDQTATQAARFKGLMTLPNKMRFALIPSPH